MNILIASSPTQIVIGPKTARDVDVRQFWLGELGNSIKKSSCLLRVQLLTYRSTVSLDVSLRS